MGGDTVTLYRLLIHRARAHDPPHMDPGGADGRGCQSCFKDKETRQEEDRGLVQGLTAGEVWSDMNKPTLACPAHGLCPGSLTHLLVFFWDSLIEILLRIPNPEGCRYRANLTGQRIEN